MKIMTAAILLITTLSAPALAFDTLVTPNGAGGFNVSTPGQLGSQILPNGAGGYNVSTPGKSDIQVTPDGAGGYSIDSRGRPVPAWLVPAITQPPQQ